MTEAHVAEDNAQHEATEAHVDGDDSQPKTNDGLIIAEEKSGPEVLLVRVPWPNLVPPEVPGPQYEFNVNNRPQTHKPMP